MHFIIDIVSMVILCWSNHVCHKHEVPWGCPCTINFQIYSWHSKYTCFQTCTGDIWHWHHCDPRLWTLALHPWHIHSWYRRWWGYPCMTNFQAYSWHPKYIDLQTCMGDIWHWHHCDPRLWTLAPCSRHIHSWCRSWGCPYTTSPLITQQYPYEIFLFPHLTNIWYLLSYSPMPWLIIIW